MATADTQILLDIDRRIAALALVLEREVSGARTEIQLLRQEFKHSREMDLTQVASMLARIEKLEKNAPKAFSLLAEIPWKPILLMLFLMALQLPVKDAAIAVFRGSSRAAIGSPSPSLSSGSGGSHSTP